MDTYDVICVGFSTLDITLTGIPADVFELEMDTVRASSSGWTVGGDGANQAAALGALGNKTAFVSKIASDQVGKILLDMLDQRPIDLQYMVVANGIESSFVVVCVRSDGHRNFLFWPGDKENALRLEEIDLSILDKTRALSIGSLFCMPGMDQGGTETLCRLAKEKGVLTFADMATDSLGIGPKAMETIYPYIDYLMPSLEEATYVTGHTKPEQIADALLVKGVGTALIKLGKDGCYVQNAEEAFYVPSFHVDAVDTTGCGDNFSAGFITGVLQGRSLFECARLGNAAGALNATQIGAHGAVRSITQLEDFMHQRIQ